MQPKQDPSTARRIELILEQIEALPTLSSVAARLLRASSSSEVDFKEIVTLIESDPALTARLLALCRRAGSVTSEEISTVERAVVHLGFDAVRAAALSVHIYDLMAEPPGRELDKQEEGDARAFDRRAYWRRSIAVACAAEALAEEHRADSRVPLPTEAFACGMLHGVGLLALEYILPRSFARVIELAERTQRDIADVERAVIGLDHYTAGRRLAEHWGLPRVLHDVIWMHAMPFESLPDVAHRKTIGVVGVAVAMARRLHIGSACDFGPPSDPAALCRACGLDPDAPLRIERLLHERVAERARALGLDEPGSDQLLLESIAQANHHLARMRSSFAERERTAQRQTEVLGAIAAFHRASLATSDMPGVCAHIALSAARMLRADFIAIVRPSADSDRWETRSYRADAEPIATNLVDPPDDAADDLSEALAASECNGPVVSQLRWLCEAASPPNGADELRVIPLIIAPGRACALIHNGSGGEKHCSRTTLQPLVSVWSAALAGADVNEDAERLNEALADTNRNLVEAREKLVEIEALKRLAEFSAGAAHEMNNPLTVIYGRAQLLAERVASQRDMRSLEAIEQAATKLSDIMTSLRLFADPPRPSPAEADIGNILGRALRQASSRVTPDPARLHRPRVRLIVEQSLPKVRVDAEQIVLAVTEAIVNSLEADQTRIVEVRAHQDPADGRLIICVRDDGGGMSDHAVKHAFDPFFSEKKAGRKQGLGLARARRLVGLNGGDMAIRSVPGQGTTVLITLDPNADGGEHAAPERDDEDATDSIAA